MYVPTFKPMQAVHQIGGHTVPGAQHVVFGGAGNIFSCQFHGALRNPLPIEINGTVLYACELCFEKEVTGKLYAPGIQQDAEARCTDPTCFRLGTTTCKFCFQPYCADHSLLPGTDGVCVWCNELGEGLRGEVAPTDPDKVVELEETTRYACVATGDCRRQGSVKCVKCDLWTCFKHLIETSPATYTVCVNCE